MHETFLLRKAVKLFPQSNGSRSNGNSTRESSPMVAWRTSITAVNDRRIETACEDSKNGASFHLSWKTKIPKAVRTISLPREREEFFPSRIGPAFDSR